MKTKPMKHFTNNLPKSCFIMLVLLGICICANTATAGLIHHKIKVRNTTSGTADIALTTADGHKLQATINSNSEYTFNIGVKCAKYLKGGVSSNYAYSQQAIDQKYPYYCVRDGRSSPTPSACVMSCASSEHKITFSIYYDGSSSYIFEKE